MKSLLLYQNRMFYCFLVLFFERICGKEIDEQWILEGKRFSPIFHRPSPETIFLPKANGSSYEQFIQNHRLPSPSQTATFLKSINQSVYNNKNTSEDRTHTMVFFEYLNRF